MARRGAVPFAAAFLLAAGCAGGSDDGPPTLHFGQDACAQCRMIVSEQRFASAVMTHVDGHLEPSAFDDLGCLFLWEEDHAGAAVTRWVQDASGAGWVSAESAWYVRSAEIRSPMGSGIAAYATRDAAESTARSRDGELFDWNDLRETARTRNLLTPPPAANEG